ncbi:MAG: hypothetical protein HY962_02575 [Ignavibacteriae bacterium]|nr:hypothetical protein [Ignavibacteriota bacterium]
MKRLVIVLMVAASVQAVHAQRILVDHRDVALFDSIPAQYRDAAQNLRMLFMDRSVGGNISDALNCLSVPWSNAPNSCKRYQHRDSAYAVAPSEVYWNGTWDRRRWRYEFWPSGCSEDANCFVNFIEPRIDSFDVVGFQFSYLAVMPGANIIHPIDGFFGTRTDRGTATSYTAFAARHPQKTVIWWTTSLARGIGSPESQAFNTAMRDYARNYNLVLFDVADILSHTPAGAPCFDNRDGVAFLTENYPDDGLDIPAICPQYTTETDGGHLGSISAGGIRVAKAFWVLMARIAGWDGRGGSGVTEVPDKVQLVSPAHGTILASDTARFVWRRSQPQVTWYRIEIADSAGFARPLFADSSRIDTTFTTAQLPRGRELIWRVQARNAKGWGAWSDPRLLTLAPLQLFSAVPITEMGRSTYKNFGGGLYPDGTNQRPSAHETAGRALAHAITPLDSLGRPDPVNGKIGLMSIGMSNTGQEYAVFENVVDTFQMKNPNLVVVSGAQSGQTASIIRDPNADYWRIINEQRLPSRRLTPAQVQVVWLKQANIAPTQVFPVHATMLQDDIEAIVRLLPRKYPNVRLLYLSSRTYGGYATTQLNPEPYAYESGFSVKWLVQKQIDGDTALVYTGTAPRAPWLAWGPYLWADGPNPRSDNGLFYVREDFIQDGTHPSETGRAKVARLLLDFFRTDSTTVPWFLRRNTTAVEQKGASSPILLQIISDAAGGGLSAVMDLPRAGSVLLEQFDVLGIREAVLLDSHLPAGRHTVAISPRPGSAARMFFLRLSTADGVSVTRGMRQ